MGINRYRIWATMLHGLYSHPLRIQSEAYPAIRASFEGDVLMRPPMRRPVLIGLRDVFGEQKLILKLRKRKNERGISILTRHCFCRGSSIAPAGLCHVRNFWPAVRRTIGIDCPLFPSTKSKNGNSAAKAVSTKLDVPGANRYSLKGFRRGVATEIARSDSTLSTILVIGGWRGTGYRYYIELHEDEEKCMKKLISVIDSGEDSSRGHSRPPNIDNSCGSPRDVYI